VIRRMSTSRRLSQQRQSWVHLLAAQAVPTRTTALVEGRRIVEGDHIEVALHHHRLVALRMAGAPIQAEEVLALLEHLVFRGVRYWVHPPSRLRPPKPIPPGPLAVVIGHHSPDAGSGRRRLRPPLR